MAALLEKASKFLNNEQADDALKSAKEAHEEFKKKADLKGRGDACRVLVNSLRLKQQNDEAKSLAKEELAFFEGKSDKRGKACALLALAEIKYRKHGSKGRDEAFVNATEAVKLAREVGDDKLLGDALMILANVHISKGTKNLSYEDYILAQTTAEESYAAFQKASDQEGQARSQHALAMSFVYQGDIQSGIRCANTSKAIWQQMGLKKSEAFEQMCISKWMLQSREAGDALEAATTAAALCEDAGTNKNMSIQARGLQVAAALSQGDVQKAKAAANEALEAARAAKDAPAEAQALGMLYDCYHQNHEERDANRTVLLAMKTSTDGPRTNQVKMWEANFMEKVAWDHFNDKESDAAERHVKEALNRANDLGEKTTIANLIGMLGSVNSQKKNHKEAIEKANEMRDMMAENGNVCGEGHACLSLASARAAKGSCGRAIASCRTALELFEECQDPTGQAEALFMMARLQIHTDQCEAAMRTATKGQNIERDDWGKFRHMLLEGQASLGVASKSGPPPSDAWDTALKCAQAVVSMANALNSDSRVLEAQYNLAQVMLMMGNVGEGMQVIDDAMSLCEKTHDEVMEAYFSCLLAQLYIQQGDKEKAKAPINEALDVFTKNKHDQGIKIAQDLLDSMNPKKKQAVKDESSSEDESEEEEVAPKKAAPKAAAVKEYTGPSLEEVVEQVKDAALQLIGADELPADTPLMDAGLDSLAAVEYQGMLTKVYSGIQLPSTLIFDFPSAKGIAELLYAEVRKSQGF